MLAFLRISKQTIDKRRSALKEDCNLQDYIQATDFIVTASPFPHIVVDEFFKAEVYKRLWRHFQSVLERGLSQENDQTRFHPFLNLRGEYEYDGYVYTPRPGEDPTLNVFFSLAWNLFFSRLLKQPSGWCTSLAYHYHPVENRTGFVHHDYTPRLFSFNDRLSNGTIFRERTEEPGGNAKAPVFQEMRTIALLYYLNNNGWAEGEGGETGLYRSKGESPVKLVAPKNNRMLAFRISPKSFHAFQENFKPRSSIVQWFHIDPAWCKEKYGSAGTQ